MRIFDLASEGALPPAEHPHRPRDLDNDNLEAQLAPVACGLVELVLLVCKECFAGGLACLLLLLPLRLNLAVMLVDGLTANDILLASVDGHLQPLEDLAHVSMVPINLLLSEGRNYFLDVVDGLVGFELIRLLAINLVFEHALW